MGRVEFTAVPGETYLQVQHLLSLQREVAIVETIRRQAKPTKRSQKTSRQDGNLAEPALIWQSFRPIAPSELKLRIKE